MTQDDPVETFVINHEWWREQELIDRAERAEAALDAHAKLTVAAKRRAEQAEGLADGTAESLEHTRLRAERAEAERDLALGVKATANKRAERAEAEVEQRFRTVVHQCCEDVQTERALADELAEALLAERANKPLFPQGYIALIKWGQARRES